MSGQIVPSLQRAVAKAVGRADKGFAADPSSPALGDQDPGNDRTRRISVKNIVKYYHTPIGYRKILDNINFEVGQGEKIAVVGRNGAGKSTLLKLISGVETPTSGSISRGLFMSWPLGFSGGLGYEMTGRDNARFIARLYDKDVSDVIAFVDDFAELGAQLDVPLRDYSTGMNMRLAFALTLAVDFECLLIDEVLAVGDQRFHRKCHEALFVERRHCAMILISHDVSIIREFCSRVVVLKAGRSRVFDDIDLALDIYRTL